MVAPSFNDWHAYNRTGPIANTNSTLKASAANDAARLYHSPALQQGELGPVFIPKELATRPWPSQMCIVWQCHTMHIDVTSAIALALQQQREPGFILLELATSQWPIAIQYKGTPTRCRVHCSNAGCRTQHTVATLRQRRRGVQTKSSTSAPIAELVPIAELSSSSWSPTPDILTVSTHLSMSPTLGGPVSWSDQPNG